MAYDDVIRYVGGFGRCQKITLFLLCLPILLCTFHSMLADASYEPSWDAYYFTGVLLGGIVFGLMSDKLGRKPTYLVALVLLLIFGVDAATTRCVGQPTTYLIVAFITTAVFQVSFVIAIEIVGPAERKFAAIVVMVFSISNNYFYSLRLPSIDHQWIKFALIVPGVLFLSYFWLMPESGCWLQIQERKKSVLVTSQQLARANQVDITNQTLETLLEFQQRQEVKESSSIWKRLLCQSSLGKTLLIFFIWIVNACFPVEHRHIGANFFGEYIDLVVAAMQLSACVVLLFTLNRLGRRSILCGCLLLEGLYLMFSPLISERMIYWQWSAIYAAGVFVTTVSFANLYIFAAEQLPTRSRTLCLGLLYSEGVTCPFLIPESLSLCALSPWLFIVAGLLSLLLPETRGKFIAD